MSDTGNSPQNQTVLVFVTAFLALLFLILATQVGMPLRAIFVAVAVSDIIFLLVMLLGDKLPGKRL